MITEDEAKETEARDAEAPAVVEETVDADLMDFDTSAGADEGAVMEVRSPTTGEVLRFKDGRSFTIKFRGKDSPLVEKLSLSQQDRRISSNMRTRQPVLAGTVSKDNVELLVAATISVDMMIGGKLVRNKPEEYRALYTKFKWLYEQGDEFAGVRANFPTRSAPRSS